MKVLTLAAISPVPIRIYLPPVIDWFGRISHSCNDTFDKVERTTFMSK